MKFILRGLIGFAIAVIVIPLPAQQVEAEPEWKRHEFMKAKKTIYYDSQYGGVHIETLYVLKHHKTGACWIVEDQTDEMAMAPAPKEVCQ